MFRLLCIGVLVASILNMVIAFGLHYHPFSDYGVMTLQVIQGLALVSPPSLLHQIVPGGDIPRNARSLETLGTSPGEVQTGHDHIHRDVCRSDAGPACLCLARQLLALVCSFLCLRYVLSSLRLTVLFQVVSASSGPFSGAC